MSDAALTPQDLWYEMWPYIPAWLASPQDRKLFQDHADSLNLYVESGGVL